MTLETAKGAATIDGEFRHVVALMADIVGSSEMAEDLGAERAYLLIRQVIALMSESISAQSGSVINTMGDGVVGIFGAPIASEAAAVDACRAALAMQAAISEAAGALEAEFGRAVAVRVGVASGEVMVLGEGEAGRIDASGSALNFAARLQALADPGEVACSEDIRADLGTMGQAVEKGTFDIKGWSTPRRVYRLTGVEASESAYAVRRRRSSGRMVDRDGELETVLSWAEHGQEAPPFLLIEGPPGIGKSRLLEAVTDAVAGQKKPRYGNCTLNGAGESLSPLLEVLRAELRLRGEEARADVAEALAGLLPSGRAPSSMLLELLLREDVESDVATDHQDAFALRRDLRDALKALAGAGNRLLIIEDAHWLDGLSSDILAEIARDAGEDVRILVTSRPGQAPGWMADRSLVGHVPLRALGKSALAVIAADMLEGEAADARLIELVAERSEGNPFFAEEILRHVKSGGDIRVEAISSIQNIVFSRFDRLGDREKTLLRHAATSGRIFDAGLVAGAAGDETSTPARLIEGSNGLVETAPGQAKGVLRFTHVLIRDVIYGSVPDIQKPELHLSVAEAIEASGRGEAQAETLADHFHAGGAGMRALPYHLIAARRALRQYALGACDARMQRAFDLIETDENVARDAPQAALLETWIRCLDLIGEFVRLDEIMMRHDSRLTDGSEAVVCRTLWSKSLGHMARFDEALDVGDGAIALAEKIEDTLGLAWARVVRMRNLMDSGRDRPGEMAALFEATRAVAESGADKYLGHVRLYTMSAWHRRMGRFAISNRMCSELSRIAEGQKDARGIAHGAWARAVLARFRQDNDDVLKQARISIANAIPGTSDYMVAEMMLTVAEVEGGLSDDIDKHLKILERARSQGNNPLANAVQTQHALVTLRRGKVREGWRLFEEAFEETQRTGMCEARNFMNLAKAEVLLALGGMMPSSGARPKLGLRDILFVLGLRRSAPARVRAALDSFRAATDATGGAHGFQKARLLLAEAVLATKRDKALATEQFDAARQLFEQEELGSEARRVDGIRDALLGS